MNWKAGHRSSYLVTHSRDSFQFVSSYTLSARLHEVKTKQPYKEGTLRFFKNHPSKLSHLQRICCLPLINTMQHILSHLNSTKLLCPLSPDSPREPFPCFRSATRQLASNPTPMAPRISPSISPGLITLAFSHQVQSSLSHIHFNAIASKSSHRCCTHLSPAALVRNTSSQGIDMIRYYWQRMRYAGRQADGPNQSNRQTRQTSKRKKRSNHS